MNRKLMIILVLVFIVIATQAFASSMTYDNVHFSWGGNSLQLRNNNTRGVTVTLAVEMVNPNNERDTRIETNIVYSIESGGGRTWTAPHPYIIREIRSINVRIQ